MTDSAEKALGEGVQDNPKASVAALVALWAPQEWDLGVQGEVGAVCLPFPLFSGTENPGAEGSDGEWECWVCCAPSKQTGIQFVEEGATGLNTGLSNELSPSLYHHSALKTPKPLLFLAGILVSGVWGCQGCLCDHSPGNSGCQPLPAVPSFTAHRNHHSTQKSVYRSTQKPSYLPIFTSKH